MTTALHSSMEGDDLHIPWRTFADDAARLAHTIVAGDESFMFYVVATNEMWTIKNGAWSVPVVPARYAGINDEDYTQASPRRLVTGGPTALTIQGTTGIQRNLLRTEVWDTATNKVLAPVTGKTLNLRLTMNIRPVSNTNTSRAVLSMDIGGTQGVIDFDISALFRGAGVWQPVRFSMPALFQEGTFVTNGGTLLLEPISTDIDIADVKLLIIR